MPICIALLIATTAAAQQPSSIPSESELPRSEWQSGGVEDLPAESRVPLQGPSTGEATPDNPSGSQSLPGEDALPADAVDDRGDDRGDDRTSGALPGQIQPLLRLDYDGHTDTVHCLDLSDDGRTMVSGGDDKTLHVWRRADVGETGWLHQRSVRWPITRGPRGRIYDAAMNGSLAAFAGHGSFGGNGEIRVVDVRSGELEFEPLVAQHRQVIASLAWPAEGQSKLASIDGDGQLVLWQRDPASGLWSGETLVDADSVTFNPTVAAALRPYRTFVPMTFLGSDRLVVPRYGRATEETVIWHLELLDLSDGSRTTLDNVDHFTHLVNLTATPDGSRLVSCDYSGSLAVWFFDPGQDPHVSLIDSERPVLSLDISSDGKRLLVGTRQSDDPRSDNALQLWDLESDPPRKLSERKLSDYPRAVVLDATFNEAIVAQGNRIEIYLIEPGGEIEVGAPRQLAVPVRPITRVAFSKHKDRYEVAFAHPARVSDEAEWAGVFDFAASRLNPRGPIDEDDFLTDQRTATRWSLSPPQQTSLGFRTRLIAGGQPRGLLPLMYERHGFPTAICTLPVPPRGTEEPDELPETGAVIVGTSIRNDIYVYAADDSDPPRLLRQFRGHSGAVLSLSTSADGRYLVSSASDMTMVIWNLEDLYAAAGTTINLWGVDFEIDQQRLIAAEVREDGPLYFRGLRAGDEVISIQWVDPSGRARAESDPEKMFDHLLNVPFDEQVIFNYSRSGRPQESFQSHPAWRPLATAFVDDQREWAYWTPAGFYDASFNGHERFGWQVNRGLTRTPDYFRAAQFKESLERPDIMERLLEAGSLPAAMRAAPAGDDAIVMQYRNKPSIRLVSPSVGRPIDQVSLDVEAIVDAPDGSRLIDPRAFISGVPARSRELVGHETIGDRVEYRYRWRFELPSDPQLQLEILAATEARAVGRLIETFEQTPRATRKRPRLHLLAIGVGEYPDPQIPSLEFAADGAAQICESIVELASPLYRVTADQLINEAATRPMWNVFAQQAAERLRATVTPDDLVVMYLCGHGIRDRRTDQWYFVTADARYHDLMNDEYSECLSFSDLAALAELPCRKLAILDSCHSGAVQPVMDRDDLKSAMRFLQDDLVFTITASEGDEEAAEQREERMGRFTAKLLEALRGGADRGGATGDRIVTLDELIDYVSETVAEESEREGMAQHPTASPAYLLKTIYLPLAAVDSTE